MIEETTVWWLSQLSETWKPVEWDRLTQPQTDTLNKLIRCAHCEVRGTARAKTQRHGEAVFTVHRASGKYGLKLMNAIKGHLQFIGAEGDAISITAEPGDVRLTALGMDALAYVERCPGGKINIVGAFEMPGIVEVTPEPAPPVVAPPELTEVEQDLADYIRQHPGEKGDNIARGRCTPDNFRRAFNKKLRPLGFFHIKSGKGRGYYPPATL